MKPQSDNTAWRTPEKAGLRYRPGFRGFTIIEMIVAFGIAAFMIFAFHSIFNQAASTARRSVQTSDFIHKSMAFEEQLQQETQVAITPGSFNTTTNDPNPPIFSGAHMLGPYGSTDNPTTNPAELGGILIIVQYRFNNIPMVSDTDAQHQPGVQYQADVRSDQLMFVYDQTQGHGRKLTPVAPSAYYDYGGNLDDTTNSNYVRLWYGHAALTSPNGTYASATDDLGVGGLNQYPVNWTLARQVLFTMIGDETTGAPVSPTTQYFAQGIVPDANVNTYNQPMYLGLADVTSWSWRQVTQNNLASPAYLGGNDTLGIPDSPTYNDRAARTAFVNYRLQVNPTPNLNSPTNPDLSNLSCRAIASTTPIFMNNVSDFVVEFAHDYFTDQDYNPNGTPSPDGKIDTYYNDDGELQIRWYSAYPNNTWTGGTNNSGSSPDPAKRAHANSADVPLTWLPPTDNNPAYIAGGTYPYAGQGDKVGGVFVWGQEGSQGFEQTPTTGTAPAEAHRWPWLLRIRYRLHDRHGEYRGRVLDEGTSNQRFELGQWFEVIVPVNHQSTSTPSTP